MTLPVIMRPEALRDVQSAWEYHEAIRIGMGDDFLGRLREFLRRVEGMPHLYAIL